MAVRPAVQRGVAVLADRQRQGPINDAERENYFGATQFAARQCLTSDLGRSLRRDVLFR
jgi:hypothetical protein